MLGAIIGDIVGSTYENSSVKTKDFDFYNLYSQYTDDTVLTLAIASAIVNKKSYKKTLKTIGERFPKCGYGGGFYNWIFTDSSPYNSYGNGSAMRVSSIGWAFDTKEEVLEEARKSSEISHNHIEGIKGAQAIALCIYLARKGFDKSYIREEISKSFSYNLNRSVDAIRQNYRFQISCQKSVPEAIICFLESTSFEDAIRNAISLGGDADTQGAIAGSIAEAYYRNIPTNMIEYAIEKLSPFLLNELFHLYQYLRMDSKIIGDRIDENNSFIREYKGFTITRGDPVDSLIINILNIDFDVSELRQSLLKLIINNYIRIIIDMSLINDITDEFSSLIILVKKSVRTKTGELVLEGANKLSEKKLIDMDKHHNFYFSKDRVQSLGLLKIRDMVDQKHLNH